MRHVSYHMEHYIRRMPTRAGGSRRIQRACIILDMDGFRPTTLPYIKECIDVLRNHYPGRLGAACFINVPPYFYPAYALPRGAPVRVHLRARALPASCMQPAPPVPWPYL